MYATTHNAAECYIDDGAARFHYLLARRHEGYRDHLDIGDAQRNADNADEHRDGGRHMANGNPDPRVDQPDDDSDEVMQSGGIDDKAQSQTRAWPGRCHLWRDDLLAAVAPIAMDGVRGDLRHNRRDILEEPRMLAANSLYPPFACRHCHCSHSVRDVAPPTCMMRGDRRLNMRDVPCGQVTRAVAEKDRIHVAPPSRGTLHKIRV